MSLSLAQRFLKNIFIFCFLATSEEFGDLIELFRCHHGGNSVLARIWWRSLYGLVHALSSAYGVQAEPRLLQRIRSGSIEKKKKAPTAGRSIDR